MRRIDPAFHHAALGFARFRDFLASCPQIFVIEHSGTDLTVALASGHTDVATSTTAAEEKEPT